MRLTRRVVTASLLAMALSAPAFAADKPTILVSVPGLTFPFFVHMMEAFKAEAVKQGYEPLESDGQVSSPKQTADIEAALAKGVKGIVLSPHTVDAMAPALQEAIDAKVAVVTIDRRVPSVTERPLERSKPAVCSKTILYLSFALSSTLCRPLLRSIAGLAPGVPCRLIMVAPLGNILTIRLP